MSLATTVGWRIPHVVSPSGGGFIVGFGDTSDTNTGTLPPGISAQIAVGDALFIVLYTDNSPGVTLTGFDVISTHLDSSPAGRIWLLGRLADGSPQDANTAFSFDSALGGYLYSIAVVRGINEAFPVGFAGFAWIGGGVPGTSSPHIGMSFAGAESVAYAPPPFTYSIGATGWDQFANDAVNFTPPAAATRNIQMLSAWVQANGSSQPAPAFSTTGNAGGGGDLQLTVAIGFTP